MSEPKGRHKKRPGTSRAQQRFIARMYAQKAEDAKVNCDCPGCIMCKGFEQGCLCTIDKQATYLSKGGTHGMVREQTTEDHPGGDPAAPTPGATEAGFPY